jgi:steroid 5-alpha reductase family enzyme
MAGTPRLADPAVRSALSSPGAEMILRYQTFRCASGVPPIEEHMRRTRLHAFKAYAAGADFLSIGLIEA